MQKFSLYFSICITFSVIGVLYIEKKNYFKKLLTNLILTLAQSGFLAIHIFQIIVIPYTRMILPNHDYTISKMFLPNHDYTIYHND